MRPDEETRNAIYETRDAIAQSGRNTRRDFRWSVEAPPGKFARQTSWGDVPGGVGKGARGRDRERSERTKVLEISSKAPTDRNLRIKSAF